MNAIKYTLWFGMGDKMTDNNEANGLRLMNSNQHKVIVEIGLFGFKNK